MNPLRAPLLHFAVLGGALYVAQTALAPAAPPPRDRIVTVPAAEVARMVGQARRETGREPTAEELERRIEHWVDEELLFREARALGWHRSDPVVQMRLIRNLRFVSSQGADAADPEDPEALLAQAYALGMDRSDLVVRRRLVQRMRLAITAAATRNEPDDAELEALRAREAARLRRPPLVQLTQVFLSRDRRGASCEADARSLLAELVAAAATPEEAIGRGDPGLLPNRLPLSSERALAARLGPDFARQALRAEPGRWSGPVPSSYGMHLVWVSRRLPGRDPELAEVRRELTALWRADREHEALREAVATLREGVELRVARPAALPQGG